MTVFPQSNCVCNPQQTTTRRLPTDPPRAAGKLACYLDKVPSITAHILECPATQHLLARSAGAIR